MRLLAATAVLVLQSIAGSEAQTIGYGEGEYLNSCVACHGEQGKGDGPLADELRTRPADLTRLAQSNGGVFPYWKVFAVIDGRAEIAGHGTREMPIWGRAFLADDARTYGPIGGEAVTQERIHALADHIATLQR